MFKFLTPVSLAAVLAVSAPLAAQETETNCAEAESPTEQLLDLGQPVNDGPQLGDRYSKSKHGDWDLACIKTDSDNDPCSIVQVLHDANDKPIAEFSLFRLEGGGQAVAWATAIVPLETLLPAQLTISVDGAPGKRYNYSYCNPIGCYAHVGLTQSDVDAFKKGKVAKLSLRPAPAPDQLVELELSLTGFTAGYDIVDVVKQ
jgi:invasion protein IalB